MLDVGYLYIVIRACPTASAKRGAANVLDMPFRMRRRYVSHLVTPLSSRFSQTAVSKYYVSHIQHYNYKCTNETKTRDKAIQIYVIKI
jgi:hypothetical protein